MSTKPANWSILIADDDPINRENLTDALMDIVAGSNIQYAVNGEEAADVAKEQIKTTGKDFNLIFMDYQMPLKNGQEATHEIRKYEKSVGLDESKAAYIVTWSAARSTPYEGANAIIAKPLLADELSTLLKEFS